VGVQRAVRKFKSMLDRHKKRQLSEMKYCNSASPDPSMLRASDSLLAFRPEFRRGASDFGAIKGPPLFKGPPPGFDRSPLMIRASMVRENYYSDSSHTDYADSEA